MNWDDSMEPGYDPRGWIGCYALVFIVFIVLSLLVRAVGWL
jgi:hypothetical protein